MADEVKHIHGTPLVNEPQTVKELAALVVDLEERLAAVEAKLTAPVLAEGTDTVQ